MTFPHSSADDEALTYLKARGFTFLKCYFWSPSGQRLSDTDFQHMDQLISSNYSYQGHEMS